MDTEEMSKSSIPNSIDENRRLAILDAMLDSGCQIKSGVKPGEKIEFFDWAGYPITFENWNEVYEWLEYHGYSDDDDNEGNSKELRNPEDNALEYHDFTSAKKEIREFSQRMNSDISINKVVKAHFWNGKNITADELNKTIEEVQTIIEDLNNSRIDSGRLFNRIYEVIEFLDSQYMPGIASSIEATKQVSEATHAAQTEIDKLIKSHESLLKNMVKFKKRDNSYKHLQDVDSMWNSIQKMKNRVNLAFYLAGGAILVALVELVVIIGII